MWRRCGKRPALPRHLALFDPLEQIGVVGCHLLIRSGGILDKRLAELRILNREFDLGRHVRFRERRGLRGSQREFFGHS